MRSLLGALPLLFLSLPAWAEPLRLGDVNLTDHQDKDVLLLGDCDGPSNTAITRLKLRVTLHPAEIDHLVVTFADGTSQNLLVRERFPIEGESRWINLEGSARCVRKIAVVGDADTIRRTPNRTARVAFWGENPVAGGDAAELVDGPAASVAASTEVADVEAGATLLGRVMLSDQLDRDVIELPACPSAANPAVSAIKMGVSEHTAEIQRIRVVYRNGTESVVEVNHTFQPGDRSEWKSLPGEQRCVDRIFVVGDAQSLGFRPGKQATISFWGR